MKEIDLKASLYELTDTYPELIPILKEMGFVGVANPVTRNTLGRVTTLPEGCKKQGKDLAEVLAALRAQGFEAKE
jgi:hypothetical protein